MSNLIDGLGFSLSSLEYLGDESKAEQIVTTLLAAPRFAVPKTYGAAQPLKLKIDPTNPLPIIDFLRPKRNALHSSLAVKYPDAMLLLEFPPNGYYMVHWKKDVSPSFAGVSGGVPWATLTQESGRLEDYVRLASTLAAITNAVYGEVRNMAIPGWDLPFDLLKRLPDIPWISIYGQPYVEMFGEARIRSAPFYKIEQQQSGHFILQATKDPREAVPESVKAAIRNHLGESCFMSGRRWRYSNGRAPAFDFGNVFLS